MIIDPYTWHRVTITSIDDAADITKSIRLTRPVGYTFVAGQYTIVRVTKHDGSSLIRQYSFSSAPTSSHLEFLIQREPGGEISSWFHDQAAIGDNVEISQPFGSFILDTFPKHPVLFIAGKVGIAPFMSMLRERQYKKVHLLYSVRTADQACFPDELHALGATVITTDSAKRLDASSLTKYVSNDTTVYVCGSKHFVDALCSEIDTLTIQPTKVRRELFTLQ